MVSLFFHKFLDFYLGYCIPFEISMLISQMVVITYLFHLFRKQTNIYLQTISKVETFFLYWVKKEKTDGF